MHARRNVDLRRELRRWTRVEAFFKSTKSENSSGARNVSRTTGDKRRFGGQARALWKLFSYPFSVNPRASHAPLRSLLFFSYYIFPWTTYVTTECGAFFLSRGYLTYVSNVRINTERLSRSVNVSCTVKLHSKCYKISEFLIANIKLKIFVKIR